MSMNEDAESHGTQLQTDFPTAWAVMRLTDIEYHHERCSYRVANGGFLCDCAAIQAFIATVRMINEHAKGAGDE